DLLQFAERMGEKARVLRKKIQEGIENAQVAQITGAVIDELLRESLAQQVPETERLLGQVKPWAERNHGEINFYLTSF
ncbi:hypothetical protein ACUWC2_28730, partial [Klebsiella pneumoniae]|uniref:hypothetical protein n=1 Tax=Klebsiella pneumoniae TaxID=573 RepID=UPI0040556A5D